MRTVRVYRGNRQAIVMACAFAMIPLFPKGASGVNMDVIPSVRLEGGWDSNAFNSSTNEVSSFGTRLTPALALRFTTADKVALTISGNYEIVRYSDSEAKAADYDTWYFRIESTGSWAFTPNLSMLPSVYYLNTTNSSRRTQLVPSGDPVLPPVSIINYGTASTEEFGGALNFYYLATQNTTIGVSGNYAEQRFSDTTAGSGLTDWTRYGGIATVSHQFSPRTSLGGIFGGNHQTYSDAPDADTLSGGILFGYKFTPMFRIDGVFGWSFIRQSEAPGIPELNTSDPSGSFRVTYTSDTFTANVYGSALYSGGTGFGKATRQWTAGLALSDQFAREWSWYLSGTYQISRSVFETGAVNVTTINGTAVLRYKPWVWASLDLTGYTDRQTSDGQSGSDLSNYVATLGITIGKPYKIF